MDEADSIRLLHVHVKKWVACLNNNWRIFILSYIGMDNWMYYIFGEKCYRYHIKKIRTINPNWRDAIKGGKDLNHINTIPNFFRIITHQAFGWNKNDFVECYSMCWPLRAYDLLSDNSFIFSIINYSISRLYK